MEFVYFAAPTSEMVDFVEDGPKTCSLCRKVGPCFELDNTICDEFDEDELEGKVGCYDCLKQGRFGFIHDTEAVVSKQEALDEWERTPDFYTYQESLWLVHCDDFMVYLGNWKTKDFNKNAPNGNGRELFLEMTEDNPTDVKLWPENRKSLEAGIGYYAFRCRHCGKLRGYWDAD